jgi:hypothetical protein
VDLGRNTIDWEMDKTTRRKKTKRGKYLRHRKKNRGIGEWRKSEN